MKRLTVLFVLCMSFLSSYGEEGLSRLCRIGEYVNSGLYARVTEELSQVSQEDFNHIAHCGELNFVNAMQYIQANDTGQNLSPAVGYMTLYVGLRLLTLDPVQAAGYVHYADSLQLRSELVSTLMWYATIGCVERATLASQRNDYQAAIAYCESALSLMRSYSQEETAAYGSTLSMAGIQYYQTGQYAKAEEYLTKSIERWAPTSDDDKQALAMSYVSLGMIQRAKADYTQAEDYCLRALEIYEAVSGKQSEEYALALNHLGAVYEEKGEYEKALQKSTQAMKIAEALSDEGLKGEVALFLGSIYLSLSDFQKAEQYTLQAIELLKKDAGATSPEFAAALHNMGLLYRETGDYGKAEEYLLQAIAIRKSAIGEEHPDYAATLNLLGLLYCDQDEYKKAESYWLQALEIKKHALGEQHPDVALTRMNLGRLYNEIGYHQKAEDYLLQALNLCKATLGEVHPQYAAVLNNLGVLYYNQGHYQQAETYMQQALSVYRTIYGEQHQDYAMNMLNVGQINRASGNYLKAEPYYKQAADIYKLQFVRTLSFMSERQREAYWSILHEFFEWKLTRFVVESYTHHHPITAFAYNNELFLKGALLQSSDAIRRSVMESGDATLIRQWEELTAKRRQIMTLEQHNPQSPNLSQLRDEAEQLEKNITQSSTAYRENQQQWEVTWESVKKALKTNQVAIEFMSAPLHKDTTMYCALLLRSNSKTPEMIPLFNEKEVSGLLNTSNAKDINATYSYAGKGKELAEHIWSKVLPYIKEGEVVFFSATGLLHQIAIENLPYDSTRLMSDVFNLVRLSSTRELALQRVSKSLSHATLYGGIKYDVSADELYAESSKYKDLASRSLLNDTIDRGRAMPLPGTLKEVEQISQTLSGKYAVDVYTSLAANEESFKALSGTQQGILHLATHGFYWPDETAQQTDYFFRRMLLSMEDEHMPQTIDPLDRCGLLFAGANTALQGHSERLYPGVQDGVLTAKEISLTDLRGTDLVVLSACETGLGDVTGEGVFGLQRAFKMAGAQTILMALWKVNDEATRMLMTAFYRNYMKGQSKREAFRNAQQEVRNYTVTQTKAPEAATAARDKYKNQGKAITNATENPAEVVTTQPYLSPYYWAGFILLD